MVRRSSTWALKFMLLALATIVCTDGGAASNEELPNFSKMKVKELKKLLSDRGVDTKGYGEKTDLVKKVKESFHLPIVSKAQPDPAPPPKGAGEYPDLSNIPGMDADKLKEVMAELRGDFSSVKDPRRRKALEKLKKSGMQISGLSGMETEQIENLANMMDGGGFEAPAGSPKTSRKASKERKEKSAKPHEDDDL